MNKLILICFVLCGLTTFAQGVVIDDEGFSTFEMKEGDTTYTMKQYFIVFLKAGTNRNQSSEEVAEIQKGHLAHIQKMANDGKVCMAGPFGEGGDPTDIRGILIFNVASEEEVRELTGQDPAVKAGRLTVEVHPWWSAKGATLP